MSVAATQAAPPEVDPVEELPQKTDTELAHECKSEGNAAFRQKNYQGALKAYDQALGHAIRSNPPDVNLQGSLWNNKAMALLKMERFSEAEICCTRVLDYLKQPLPKAYHRRAGAREVMARDETLSLERRRELLENAGADLQAALAELERDQQMPSEEKKQTKAGSCRGFGKNPLQLGKNQQVAHAIKQTSIRPHKSCRNSQRGYSGKPRFHARRQASSSSSNRHTYDCRRWQSCLGLSFSAAS